MDLELAICEPYQSYSTGTGIGYLAPNVEVHDAYRTATLRRVISNDPSIAGLNVHIVYQNEEEWSDMVCRAIGQSTQLRRLNIVSDSEYPHHDLPLFCRAIAHNRSIEHLKLSQFHLVAVVDEEEGEGDIFRILGPFFEFNHKLRCIE